MAIRLKEYSINGEHVADAGIGVDRDGSYCIQVVNASGSQNLTGEFRVATSDGGWNSHTFDLGPYDDLVEEGEGAVQSGHSLLEIGQRSLEVRHSNWSDGKAAFNQPD